MDGLTFTASVIHDLAWPVTIIASVILAVRRLPQIAKLVKSIRYKDFEVTIRERLEEIEKLPTVVAANAENSTAPSLREKILRLAEIDTGVAVAAIWTDVEAALTMLMQHNGLMRFTNPVKFTAQLVKLGKLSNDELRMMENLREVRNASVHARGDSKPTLAEVAEYQKYAEALITKVNKVRSEPGYIAPE